MPIESVGRWRRNALKATLARLITHRSTYVMYFYFICIIVQRSVSA